MEKPDFDKLSCYIAMLDSTYEIKKELITIWNKAVDACTKSADAYSRHLTFTDEYEPTVDKQSILKNKIE